MRSRTPEVLAHIAASVRALRLERELTQEELAEAAGYDVRLVQFIEAGERNLTIDSLVAVADALRVPPHRLLEPSADAKTGRRVRHRP